MSKDYGTIKIRKEAWQHLNEERKEMGLTWEEYIKNESADQTDLEELEQEVAKLQELIERVPEETATKLERYR